MSNLSFNTIFFLPGIAILILNNLAKYISCHIYKFSCMGGVLSLKIRMMSNSGSILRLVSHEQYVSGIRIYMSICFAFLLCYWVMKFSSPTKKLLLATLGCCSFGNILDRLLEYRTLNFIDIHFLIVKSLQVNLFDISSAVCLIFLINIVLKKRGRRNESFIS